MVLIYIYIYHLIFYHQIVGHLMLQQPQDTYNSWHVNNIKEPKFVMGVYFWEQD